MTAGRPPLAARLVEVVRISDACTACGACLATCPERALRRAPKRPAVVDSACTACWACIEVCPAGAIVECWVDGGALPNTAASAGTVDAWPKACGGTPALGRRLDAGAACRGPTSRVVAGAAAEVATAGPRLEATAVSSPLVESRVVSTITDGDRRGPPARVPGRSLPAHGGPA